MEDFQLDLIIGEGPAARSVKIDLAPLHAGRRDDAARAAHHAAPRPFRHSGPARLLYRRRAGARSCGAAPASSARRSPMTGAARSRAARAGRRASPVGCCGACATSPPSTATTQITARSPTRRCSALEVDALGLDSLDRRYLNMIAENFGGGPVGIETISAALSEPRDAIEDIVEPYLIQQGFVQRTPRGRLLTPKAFAHLGLAAPTQATIAQINLFSDDQDV